VPFFTVTVVLMLLLCFASAGYGQSYIYANPASISTGDNSTGSPYPSTITVAETGTISRVTVQLNGVTTTRPDDMGVLLVSPSGNKIRLMTDSGGTAAVTAATIVFDDLASGNVPDAEGIPSGTYKPSQGTNHPPGQGTSHPNNFPSPAPVGPYSLALSGLIGASAAGNWSLYVDDDDAGGDEGIVAGGWTLNITYGKTYTNSSAITLPATGSGPGAASPYASGISVLDAILIAKIRVRLNGLSHTYLDDLGFLLVGPEGQKVRLTTDNGGSNDATGGDYIFDDDAANAWPDEGEVPAGIYRPSADGALASGSDPHPANFFAPAPANPYGGALSAFIGTTAAGTWSLYAYDDTSADAGSIVGGWTLIVEGFAPSAASVNVSGRVTSASGIGISKTRVVLSGGILAEPMHALTNPFGYFNFTGVEAGQTYIVFVESKRYVFAEPFRLIGVNDEITGLEFVADGP